MMERKSLVFSFADIQVLEREFSIARNGEVLPVEPKAFRVLLVLLRNPHKLIPKEELLDAVWGDVAVSENSLTRSIALLRKLLGDDTHEPRYIATVPTVGYRFLCSVHVSEDGAVTPRIAGVDGELQAFDHGQSRVAWDPEGSSGTKITLGRRIRVRWWWAVLAAAAACLVVSLFAWRHTRSPLLSQLPPIEVVPLVALRGSQGSPAFSPDGNQVAFEGYEGEDGAIYTTLIGGDKPLRLTVKSNVCCPTWSPDNRQIAFIRFVEKGFSINVVSALGGSEKILYTAELGQSGEKLLFEPGLTDLLPHLDWSPDGKWLAFAQPWINGSSWRIELISLDDLTVRPLTSPIAQEYDTEPAFSPDSSRVAFERGSNGGMGRDTFLVPVTGGPVRRLTFDNAWGGSPAWTQDGAEIVFSSNRGGPMNLWRVSATGGPPRPVAGVSAIAYDPSISRKGNFLAYEHAILSAGIWQLKLTDKTHSSGHPTEVIAARSMINARPSFSPDGNKIVFESDRLGFSDIWYCDSDGSNCAQLTSLHGAAGTARWSPDGHRIAFEFQSQHYYDVYVLEVPDGRPRRLRTFPDADNGAPNWSRDGKWIYFYSSHEQGPLQLWKVPFQGGTPVRVTKNGGVYATESEDGRFLYYSKMEQPGIWKMPLNGGEEERVLDQPGAWQWFNWALTSGGIYFINGPMPKSQQSNFSTSPRARELSFVLRTN